MPEESRTRRLAILIDADNTSPRIVAGLFEEVAKYGEASVRRIYGDFSGQRLKSWAEILPKYAIDPYQQFAYTAGKNASDIALVIDAMDLLHSGRFDGFCLVSSDSDFTRLASRLREQGADVFGFGEQKTPESFRQACRKFIYTENLLPEAQVSTTEEGPPAKALQPPSAAIPVLNKAIMQMETEDGWVGLGAVGHRLANIASDFDPRTYGYRKLSDLVRKTGAFDVDQAEGRAMRIKAKPKPASKTRAKATAPGEVEVSQHRIAVRSTSTEVTAAVPPLHHPPPRGGERLQRVRRSGTERSPTLCWREMDSKFRFLDLDRAFFTPLRSLALQRAREPQPGFDDRQRQVYRAPSQAGTGNDIHPASPSLQKAPTRGPASLARFSRRAA